MEYVAAELGIWLSGNVIVPMGDSYPPDRIDYIMGHSEASLLIDKETIKAVVETQPAEITRLPDEDDMMALYYTSGSTGNPKGVIHTYHTFDFSQYILDNLQKVNPLVMGMTLSMFFVVSEYMLATLCVGGKVVVVPPAVIRDIRQLELFYLQHHITYAFFTPSLLRFFRKRSSDLQLVMVASERVSGIAPDGYKLVNIYGQTETAE
jgi:surfactin family lipopeptide synthetase A